MTILFEHALDVSSNYYDLDNEKTAVQQSIEVTMQIDFYVIAQGIEQENCQRFGKYLHNWGINEMPAAV